jgi:beta-lactamase superfamily II metal-dependent hydrolase
MPKSQPEHQINVDLAKVFEVDDKGKKHLLTILGWGDEVEVLNANDVEKGKATRVEVRAAKFVEPKRPDASERNTKKSIEETNTSAKPQNVTGFIIPPRGTRIQDVIIRIEDSPVLKVDFVDVQQGDGSVIITPKGKTILVDGGDNQLFARYLAGRFNRFTKTSIKNPRKIDCILVTHGDADHFAGLAKIHDSENLGKEGDWRRLVIDPERVYHNGLVKRPSKDKNKKRIPDEKLLGATKLAGKGSKEFLVITGLEEDLLKRGLDKQMNEPFQAWRKALTAYNERREKKIEFRRLEKGMDEAFDFVTKKEPNLKFEVLGPLTTPVGGAPGLKFLGDPPRGPRLRNDVLDIEENGFEGMSASHTINGHSVIFRLTYGGFRFLFTGDLNDESGRSLARAHRDGQLSLEAEVFKVPHHGSADFSGGFLQAVAPIVSVISSGDETARKEYVHPRATMMGALGKFSRVEEPLIFVTELVAFFEMVGATNVECHKLDKAGVAIIKDGVAVEIPKNKRSFFAFKRSNFGLVKIRTDGKRMLVYTNSGQTKLKEAYAYEIEDGKPTPAKVRQV